MQYRFNREVQQLLLPTGDCNFGWDKYSDFLLTEKKHTPDTNAGATTSEPKFENQELHTQAPRPLLPPDGPLLAQHHAGQQIPGQYSIPGQDLVVVSDSQVSFIPGKLRLISRNKSIALKAIPEGSF